MVGILLALGGFCALVAVYTVLLNARGRKAERAIARVRGAQNAASFAEMFSTEAERAVAWALYPRLEKLTFTQELPLSKADRLFSRSFSGSILSDEAAAHWLNFDDEDLWDDVLAVLTDLGCDVPKTVVADELEGVESVGQLVTALSKLASRRAIR